MIITSHGGECIKAVAGDTTLVFNPPSKKSKNLKPANFGADIAFISLNHPDMNGYEQVARAGKEPFLINGSGEYEVGAMSSAGYQTKSQYDKKELINTAYVIHFDGFTIVYLGALSEAQLPQEILEDLDEVDVLFVPIGNSDVLAPSAAQKLSVKLEAKVVVPIHHEGIGDKNALKQFLKEASAEGAKPQEKLTIKPKDLVGKSGEVVVLKS